MKPSFTPALIPLLTVETRRATSADCGTCASPLFGKKMVFRTQNLFPCSKIKKSPWIERFWPKSPSNIQKPSRKFWSPSDNVKINTGQDRPHHVSDKI